MVPFGRLSDLWVPYIITGSLCVELYVCGTMPLFLFTCLHDPLCFHLYFMPVCVWACTCTSVAACNTKVYNTSNIDHPITLGI